LGRDPVAPTAAPPEVIDDIYSPFLKILSLKNNALYLTVV